MDITFYNRNFRFVFEKKQGFKIMANAVMYELPFERNRFLIGAGQISKYVTPKNAETVLNTAKNMKVDKTTVKFRKYGKIEIYVK